MLLVEKQEVLVRKYICSYKNTEKITGQVQSWPAQVICQFDHVARAQT